MVGWGYLVAEPAGLVVAALVVRSRLVRLLGRLFESVAEQAQDGRAEVGVLRAKLCGDAVGCLMESGAVVGKQPVARGGDLHVGPSLVGRVRISADQALGSETIDAPTGGRLSHSGGSCHAADALAAMFGSGSQERELGKA